MADARTSGWADTRLELGPVADGALRRSTRNAYAQNGTHLWMTDEFRARAVVVRR
jgi:hypothetical protein